MNKLYTLLSVTVLVCTFFVSPARAEISPWELRQTLDNYLTANEILSENTAVTDADKEHLSASIQNLRSKINRLSDAQLQLMIDAMPNSKTYANQIAKLVNQANALAQASQASAASTSS